MVSYIFICLYLLGLGFLIGCYFETRTGIYSGDDTPFEQCLTAIFSPIIALVWLFYWTINEFFGFDKEK